MIDSIYANNIRFSLDVTEKVGKLTRCIIELSDKFFTLPAEAFTLQKGTYFISIIKLPRSLIDLGVTVFEIRNVNSLKTGSAYLFVVTSKTSLVAKDAFDLLKGLKAFGCLNERYFVVLKVAPFFSALVPIFLANQFYVDSMKYLECEAKLSNFNGSIGEKMLLSQEKEKLDANLYITGFSLGGIALMTLSTLTFAPLAIPAHVLLTASAYKSLQKVLTV